MADVFHYSLEDIKTEVQGVVDESLKPFVGRVRNIENCVFGENWDGGLKGWANRQNGYLKGIKTMLSWGIPILTAINVAVLAAVLTHIAGK